jgi:hypothetical protein
MKKMLIASVCMTGLCLVAGRVSADPGGFAPPVAGLSVAPSYASTDTLIGAGGLPPGRGPDQYGWNPFVKRLLRKFPGFGCGDCTGCGNCGSSCGGNPHCNPLANPANWAAGGYGQGGPAYNPHGFPPGAYGPHGPVMQGTLVFPHHPFVRSPRDYFMLDLNK